MDVFDSALDRLPFPFKRGVEGFYTGIIIGITFVAVEVGIHSRCDPRLDLRGVNAHFFHIWTK